MPLDNRPTLILSWFEEVEWRDIETAPQDHTWILGLTTSGDTVICIYQPRTDLVRRAPFIGAGGVTIGVAWGMGHLQYRLVKWKPFDFPRSKPVELTLWKKILQFVGKGRSNEYR